MKLVDWVWNVAATETAKWCCWGLILFGALWGLYEWLR